MENYQTVLTALAEKSIIQHADSLTKVIKPIDSGIFSGEYSPLILPSLAKYQYPRALDKNLEKLRAGNDVSGTIDFAGDQVAEKKTTITYLDRTVPVEMLVPNTLQTEEVLLYFHGGSFYGGKPADVHDFLKAVALKSSQQVISVDYSLAPEQPFPAGIWDGAAVALYIQREMKQKIAIAGDSAGGNIALAVARLCRDLGYHGITAQILLYPVLTFDLQDETLWDLAAYPIRPEQSVIRDHLFERTMSLAAIMKDYYLRHNEKIDAPLISPLAAKEVYNMPRTLILAGEYDFFRQANEAFARKLTKADISVRFLQYNGMIHAFAPLVGLLPQAEDVVNEISTFLRS